MCNLHPKNNNLTIINDSFDNQKFFDNLNYFDLIISSSSIQWSNDLDKLFDNISKHTQNIAFSIFTSNTFKTLHNWLNIKSPIYTKEILIDKLKLYFEFNFEIKNYKIEFETIKDIFRYIKKSGVSGGQKKLSFQETKRLLTQYPYNFLEFEVLFVVGRVK
jgi:malonyl-CoA O-methyltransferase